MSSLMRTLVESQASTGRAINDFLWEGRPHKSPKIERSKEELEEFLEKLRVDAWQRYRDAADELEWGV